MLKMETEIVSINYSYSNKKVMCYMNEKYF